jgi:ABC-2 type transport system permease protein
MNKILLIIQREYFTRVKKKSFLIMTILGPLLMGGVFVAIALMDKVDTEQKKILVVDETLVFKDRFADSERVDFLSTELPLRMARHAAADSGYFGVLYIPATANVSALEKAVVLYSESQPGMEVVDRIESTIEKEINEQKYIEAGIDPEKLAAIRTNVQVGTRDMEDQQTSTPLASGLGFAGGFLIYMFIFIYGAMVMRGVLEEKTNRIIEVIISSVKPFQLMMGKIIGVALVGLTQFMLWVVLTTLIFTVVGTSMGGDVADKEMVQSVVQSGQMPLNAEVQQIQPQDALSKVTGMMATVNFPLMIGMFIFYFLGGYLLYSALFAAVGAAVDAETDVQQFMLPITIPLIISYVAAINVLNNPQGNIAFWFSIIPFTSPIVMMVRIPFGVPWYEVALSMVLLVGGFIFTTWLAGKIYRIGILMYGKKPSYKELWKWIRFHQ